jgi:thioredoxin reductase (NADPH)
MHQWTRIPDRASMLTIDDVAAIPLFGSLALEQLNRLARSAADIRLAAGEFAVHAGEAPALYAVLSGKVEVVKAFDGIERTLGWRNPGQIFGEVPIALGSPFPGSYRASEPSRVMRIELQQYYALAAVAPEISQKVSALARERIGGLQSLAAEPQKPRVTLVCPRFDTEGGHLRRFLARNQISFNWVTPDAPDLPEHWAGPCPAEADCPALRFADGETMIRPNVRDLADRLGLQTGPRIAEYDVAIIGAGPAGLAAAVYGASEGLRTIVIEREAPGGQAGTSSRIENYLGFPSGVSGDELASRALQQARRLGAEILVTRSVEHIDPAAHRITLDGGEIVQARTLILATGVTWRRLSVEGFDRFIGKGIYYGAARSEVGATHGLNIHLVGAGNSAGQAALYFANHADTVTLVVRGDSLEKSMSQYLIDQIRAKPNIVTLLHAEIVAVHGETSLTAIDIRSNESGETRRHDCGGVFNFIGADAETGWLPAEITRDARGFVLTGDDLKKTGQAFPDRDPYLLETSVPGVFACGDVRLSPVKRVAAAVGEGSMAIAFVHQYLAREGRKASA